jgi:hypothetical protein
LAGRSKNHFDINERECWLAQEPFDNLPPAFYSHACGLLLHHEITAEDNNQRSDEGRLTDGSRKLP